LKKKLNLLFAVIAISVVLTLSACNKGTANNAGNTAPPTGGTTKEITVSATNFSFDQPDIKLNVGDTVKLTLKNVNGTHGLAIPDLKVNIKNGETATFTVTKAGIYEYNCSIQCGSGHDNMVGKITVT
jgi:cytochrome c oxidase subunit 2